MSRTLNPQLGARRPASVAVAAVGMTAVLLLMTGCSTSPSERVPAAADAVLTPEGTRMTATELTITDRTVPGLGGGEPGSARVPVRIYEPAAGDPWATLAWAHGGSFVRGTLDWPEADWVAHRFAEHGVRVVSVDYVLASDTVKAPAPSNDVTAAVAWAGETYDGPLIVGGASAGAHLAVLAALEHVDRTPNRAADALLLEYPTLHRVQRDDTALAAAAAALPEQRRFRADRIADMYDFYLGDSDALVAGELPEVRLAELPPVIIVNADVDELRASGEEFAEQLRAAGVDVSEAIQPGTVHGYMNRPEEDAQSLRDAHATITRFVAELRRILGT